MAADRIQLQQHSLFSDSFLDPLVRIARSRTPSRTYTFDTTGTGVKSTKREFEEIIPRRLRDKAIGILAVRSQNETRTPEPIGFAYAYETPERGHPIFLGNVGLKLGAIPPVGLTEAMVVAALSAFDDRKLMTGHEATRIFNLLLAGSFDPDGTPARPVELSVPDPLTVGHAQALVTESLLANYALPELPAFEIVDMRRA